MSVFRVHKSKNYTVMSNYHLRDSNLSLKAKGLLSLMLSLPDEWDYSVAGLVSISKEGESAIRGTLNELKKNKYLVIDKLAPNESKSGRFEYVYNIYEEPSQVKQSEPKKQEPKKQGVENQHLESLGVENRGQLNTKESNTKELNKDNIYKGKHRYGELKNVLLTDEEYIRLKSKFKDWQKRIDDLSYYMGSKNVSYKSHYLTILNWARKEKGTTNEFSKYAD